MNKIILFTLLYIHTNLTWAGGDYWSVKVNEIIVTSDPKVLKLLLLEKPTGIINDCQNISIQVIHEKPPFWEWLPFVSNTNPTLKETSIAINYLNDKSNNSTETYFGYIGGGLHKVLDKKCTFESKGLKLEINNNEHIIFSFFNLS